MSQTHDVLSGRMPSLDALELLLAVARHGTLSGAAAERGVTQSAVSLRVRALERQVGLALVHRTPSGSRLTPAGRLLAEWADAVLAAAARLDAGIDSLRDDRGTHLHVAASMTIAERLLPRWLAQLRGDHADLTVTLTAVNSAQVAALVDAGTVDLGFVEGPDVARALSSRTVAVDALVLVCAPGTRLARRRRALTPDEVAALRLVEREPGSGTRSALDHAVRVARGTANGRRAEPALEVSSTAALVAAVAQGVGPAVVSALAVTTELDDGRLVALPTTGLSLHRRLRAVWRRGSPPLGPGRDLLVIATRPRSTET